MSGILDSKTRILDAAVTAEGRRQLAEGTFIVTYASFSDAEVVYTPDEIEGHVDPANRIYLEAAGNLLQDQIVFEANDDGNLVALRDKSIDVQRVDSLFPKRLAASFVDGKTIVQQLNFGARIKLLSVPSSYKEKNPLIGGPGFSYTDSNNNKAYVFLTSSYIAGTSSISVAESKILVGVKGGINASQLTTAIQEQIEIFASGTGPKVQAVDRQNFLYVLDVSGSHEKVATKLLTGSFNSVFDEIPIVVQESLLGGRIDTVDLSQNADFSSQIVGILTSSVDNFKNLEIISTIDSVFEEDKFTLSEDELVFSTDRIESKAWPVINHVPSLNAVDSIFSDDKLSNLLNFRYLPPIVKTSAAAMPNKSDIAAIQAAALGNYPPFGNSIRPITFSQIQNQLNVYENRTITFPETSRKNSLITQIFEVVDGQARKLDIVEYGDVRNDPNDPSVVSDKIYFIGKTFLDDRGTTCFINMFTLIFSRAKSQEL